MIDFQMLEKYLGDPKVRSVWERHSTNFKLHLNTCLACMEQCGPLLQEDIDGIAADLEALHDPDKAENYNHLFGDVIQKHTERNRKGTQTMEFCDKLKEARSKVGLSQQTLADLTKIPKRTIENWETGTRTPPEYVQRFLLNELAGLSK